MNFEEYLISKKIDSAAFRSGEPATWESWRNEWEQMHPNSFTAQKLYLINPIRRKFPLKGIPAQVSASPVVKENETSTTVAAKPKPVMRPKPKIS